MNSYTITSLGMGIVFGLSAGLSPGPLLALVVAQALRHSVKEGIKVTLAPLVTDLPIIIVSLLVLKQFSKADAFLGIISLVGGLFVAYLAYGSLWAKNLDTRFQESAPRSLTKGAMVNLLNPHPYLFWVTVGSPTMVKAWSKSPIAATAFVTGFYTFLIGSKIVVAILSGRSRQLVRGRVYVYLMRLIGAMLLIFAFLLIKDGLGSLGIVR